MRKKNSNKQIGPTNLEYWTSKGLSDFEAKQKLSKIRQLATKANINKSIEILRNKIRVGDRFGSRIVISDEIKLADEIGKKPGSLYILVRCDCGGEDWVRASNFLRGNGHCCRRCLNVGEKSSTFNGWKDMPGSVWSRVKTNAESRKHTKNTINFNQEYLWKLFHEQNKRCKLSGISLDWQSASLDRIDSSKGYITGNVQWVHKIVNKMKLAMTDSEFITWCKLITEHNK